MHRWASVNHSQLHTCARCARCSQLIKTMQVDLVIVI